MKKFISMLLALAMTLGLSVPAFAAEIPANTLDTASSVSDVSSETVTPRSSISGYAYGVISKDHPHIVVDAQASGIGGLGTTVKISCSQNLRFGLTIVEESYRIVLDDATVRTNQENYFNNLLHFSGSYYVFTFTDIPDGVTADCWIWIYG